MRNYSLHLILFWTCHTLLKDTVLELLKEAVEKSHAEHPDKLILLDGFPRELQQAQSFEEKVFIMATGSPQNPELVNHRQLDLILMFPPQICPASFVLSFDCSEAIMTERLLARAKTRYD